MLDKSSSVFYLFISFSDDKENVIELNYLIMFGVQVSSRIRLFSFNCLPLPVSAVLFLVKLLNELYLISPVGKLS